jgi:predicted TIM-barrel fold metal-dependent hydrolase
MDKQAQAARFDDAVLLPFLVRRAAELAAARQVPLQFHTGFGDPDVYLPHADPALLWPLLRDPRTEECPMVLLHSYPFVGAAAYLAGTYPQVHMDLSLAIPLAEPIATRLVAEALGLCPPGKLLAASDGHSYPEMHWWGATVWRHALARVLRAEVEGGGLDEPAARAAARRVLAANASRLYRL